MAQIKKFQTPAGPIEEQGTSGTKTTTAPQQSTPKYGKLVQNGVVFQATDGMIDWFDKQGYYGEQIANTLRSGEDQYLDTDAQGVGWIRNISIANPDLKERQQNKTTRAGRRLEGRRLRDAREEIQRLATYDYSKFVPTPTTKKKYTWDELVVDYNKEKDANGKTIYTYSNNSPVNFDIQRRLKSLEDGTYNTENKELSD